MNAVRRSVLQKQRHALATRMAARADDYLRFAHDLRVPFSNNEAGQVVKMSKLRIKVSACMRSCTAPRPSAPSAPTWLRPPATAPDGLTPSPALPKASSGSPQTA